MKMYHAKDIKDFQKTTKTIDSNKFATPSTSSFKGKPIQIPFEARRDDPASLSTAYLNNFYDYKMARALLDHLCGTPWDEIKAVCESDLSRGPYIFTYTKPASNITPVPPPFLLLDLSDFHEKAFPEFIAAFREQVKRDDINDRAKLETLALKILSVPLQQADVLMGIEKHVEDFLHEIGLSARSPDSEKK